MKGFGPIFLARCFWRADSGAAPGAAFELHTSGAGDPQLAQITLMFLTVTRHLTARIAGPLWPLSVSPLLLMGLAPARASNPSSDGRTAPSLPLLSSHARTPSSPQ